MQSARSWSAYCWRKARREAWKSPPIEVVRRHCRRAADLGITYRQYALILMDRGVHANTLVFDLSGTLIAADYDLPRADELGQVLPMPGVIEKLATLRNCLVLAVARQVPHHRSTIPALEAAVAQFGAMCGGLIAGHCIVPSGARSPSGGGQISHAIRELLRAHRTLPAATIMVSQSELVRRGAETSVLALFLWADHYFDRSTAAR